MLELKSLGIIGDYNLKFSPVNFLFFNYQNMFAFSIDTSNKYFGRIE
jgi:hypothetical protein